MCVKVIIYIKEVRRSNTKHYFDNIDKCWFDGAWESHTNIIVSLYKGEYFTCIGSVTMELLNFIRFYVVIVTMVAGRRILSRDDRTHIANEHLRILRKDSGEGPIMCARLAKEPYFGVEMLLGKAWRIYYTWNMDLHNQCLDMVFKNVTQSVRVHSIDLFSF